MTRQSIRKRGRTIAHLTMSLAPPSVALKGSFDEVMRAGTVLCRNACPLPRQKSKSGDTKPLPISDCTDVESMHIGSENDKS